MKCSRCNRQIDDSLPRWCFWSEPSPEEASGIEHRTYIIRGYSTKKEQIDNNRGKAVMFCECCLRKNLPLIGVPKEQVEKLIAPLKPRIIPVEMKLLM